MGKKGRRVRVGERKEVCMKVEVEKGKEGKSKEKNDSLEVGEEGKRGRKGWGGK